MATRFTGCNGVVDRTTSLLVTMIQFNYRLLENDAVPKTFVDWTAIPRNTKRLWRALDIRALYKCILYL